MPGQEGANPHFQRIARARPLKCTVELNRWRGRTEQPSRM